MDINITLSENYVNQEERQLREGHTPQECVIAGETTGSPEKK